MASPAYLEESSLRPAPWPAKALDVVQVCAPGRFGGLESVVALLARGLAGRGHFVRVVAFHGLAADDHCQTFDGLAAAGVEVIEIRSPPRSYLAERRALAALLAHGSPIAHSHGYHADLVTRFASADASRGAVSTAHGFTGGGLKNRAYEWAGRWAVRGFGGVIAVARPLTALLTESGVARDRIHLVPNAFEATVEPLSRSAAREALGIPGEGVVVGWVGRLTQEKAPDLFVEAIGLVEGVDASIIGEGPMRASLEEAVRAAGHSGRIRWHGGVANASRTFRAFDVLVLSSRTEGTPIVLLEAMSAGIPVVTTGVGGVPDVVGPAEAVIVPAGDAAAIARGIRLCLDDGPARAARVRAARARVLEHYSIAGWLDRHETIYRGIS